MKIQFRPSEHIYVVGQSIAVNNNPESIYYNIKLANLIGIDVNTGTFKIPFMSTKHIRNFILYPVIVYNNNIMNLY